MRNIIKAVFRTPEEAEAYLKSVQIIQKKQEKPTPPTNLKSSDLNDWYSQQRHKELDERKKREEAETMLRGYRSKFEYGKGASATATAGASSSSTPSPRSSGSISPRGSGTIQEGSVMEEGLNGVSAEVEKLEKDVVKMVVHDEHNENEEIGALDEETDGELDSSSGGVVTNNDDEDDVQVQVVAEENVETKVAEDEDQQEEEIEVEEENEANEEEQPVPEEEKEEDEGDATDDGDNLAENKQEEADSPPVLDDNEATTEAPDDGDNLAENKQEEAESPPVLDDNEATTEALPVVEETPEQAKEWRFLISRGAFHYFCRFTST